jgi:hypothetical protein
LVIGVWSRKRDQRRFTGLGYEPHLVETLEKDLLIKNPDVKWSDVAGELKCQRVPITLGKKKPLKTEGTWIICTILRTSLRGKIKKHKKINKIISKERGKRDQRQGITKFKK